MIVYRNILTNTAIYASGILIGKLSSFLLLPLYTRYLTPADYGVLELIDLAFIVATVVGMRFGEAFLYFYFRAETAEARSRVLSTALIGSAAVGVAATGVSCLFAGAISRFMFQTPEYQSYLRLMFTALAFSFLQDIGFCYFRARDKSGTFVAITTARLVLTMSLNVYFLVWCRMGLASMLWGAVIASAATALGLAWFCLYRTSVRFDFRLFRQFSTYGAPVALSSLGLLFMHYADRIFLQRCANLSEVGVYSLGYKIGQLSAYAWAAFATYWNAQMFQIVERKDGRFVYVRVFTYASLGLTAAALALAVFAGPLVQLMAAPAFGRAALFVAPIAAAYAIKGMDDYLRCVFMLEKRTGVNARVTWFGVVICFASYAILVPRFQSWGAVIATFGSFAAMALFSWFEAQRVRAFPFEYGRLARIAVCAAALFGARLAFRPDGFVAEVLLGFVTVLCFPLLLWATGFCDEREAGLLRESLSRVRRSVLALMPSGAANKV